MSNNNTDSLLIQIISVLQTLTSVGGGGGNVTIDNTPLDVTETNPITGFNLETTQQDVLTELLKSTDFTTTVLVDTGNNNQLVFRKEVLTETDGVYTITYEDLSGGIVVPVGPLLAIPELELQTIGSIQNMSTGVVCDNYSQVDNLLDLGSFPLGSVTITEVLDSNDNLATQLSIQGELGQQMAINYQTPKQSDIISMQLKEIAGDNLGNIIFIMSFGDNYDVGEDYILLSLSIDLATNTVNFFNLIIEDSINGSESIPIPLSPTQNDKIGLYYANNQVKIYINEVLQYSNLINPIINIEDVVQYSSLISTENSTIIPSAKLLLQENSCLEGVCSTCDLNNNLIEIVGSTNTISENVAKNTGEFTDYSGTISTGNMSQVVINKVLNRNYILIQNVSDTDMWINFGAAANIGAGSIKLLPNGSYELVATTGGYINIDAVNIICSVAGKEFTIKEA